MRQDDGRTRVDWIEAERARKAQQKAVYDPALDQSRGKWTRCDQCGEILYIKHIRVAHSICSKCEFPLQRSINDRIERLLDAGSWRPLDEALSPADPRRFYDSRAYLERLLAAQEESGRQDAVQTGTGLLEGRPLARGVRDFNFRGGSRGSVVGEKITRLIEYATREGLPLLLVTASGGARRQEGVLSLRQRAKISAALHVHQTCAGLPYWSLLTHPTTGGVTASFARLGDLVIAEPRARIAFAGRRVIQETLGEVLPDNFQTAEYLLVHGLLDLIIERRFHRVAFAELVLFHHYAPRRLNGHIPFGYTGPLSRIREERLRRSLQLENASYQEILTSLEELLSRTSNADNSQFSRSLGNGNNKLHLPAERWTEEGLSWHSSLPNTTESGDFERQVHAKHEWPVWPTDAELEPITLPDGRLQHPITSDVISEPRDLVRSELKTWERTVWRSTSTNLRERLEDRLEASLLGLFLIASMSILIENISKNFGSLRALRNINLEIPTGTLTALVGPSGSGKSTLLRLRAGFEVPDTGRVWLHGRNVTNLPPATRELGVVFQSYALFPHLTVWENVAFGLKQRGLSLHEQSKQITKTLNLVGLSAFSERFPSQLSGGQRQRVALARALALEPQVLLLDEPFAALDPKVRRDLRTWLRDLHKNVVVTTLLVTHDQQEAREVADQLVVFRSGRIEQAGPPREVYDIPANGFVMGFVGHASPRPNIETFNGGPIEGLVRPHGWELLSIEKDKTSFKSFLRVQMKRICYGETLVQLEVQTEKNIKLRIQLPRRKAQNFKVSVFYWLCWNLFLIPVFKITGT